VLFRIWLDQKGWFDQRSHPEGPFIFTLGVELGNRHIMRKETKKGCESGHFLVTRSSGHKYLHGFVVGHGARHQLDSLCASGASSDLNKDEKSECCAGGSGTRT
jgi:hypothetical protein